MTEALTISPNDTVLEIGTGSGYQTAILAELSDTVYTIERIPELSKDAKTVLDRLNYTNIRYSVGDGSKGFQEAAPYDKIIVTAAPDEVPQALLDQLSENGKLIIPVGRSIIQDLMLYEKHNGTLQKTNLGGCRFVPLVSE
jgi:protein-L-isoaspartate(D-aspartate) O-methyltransferase